MNKKINLSVSSSLLVGLFITGCSQQQISGGTQTAGGQQIAGGQQVATQAIDVQPTPIVTPTAIDHQVQGIVVPKAVTPKLVKPHHHDVKPVQKAHHHNIKPVQKIHHHKVKPIKKMAKPVQQHSSASTGYRSAMPPAIPGQCYAKVRTEPKFKNVVKRQQISPAVNKRILVRGPQYRHTSKREQVRPATHTYFYRPAQYRDITKRVLVKPAHYAWQKGKQGPITRIDNMTGEILCRVKVPAVYRTVVQKVLIRPGQRIKRNIPAVYRTVVQKTLASPAQYRNVYQPARFVNKTYRVQTVGVGYKWQPIDC